MTTPSNGTSSSTTGHLIEVLRAVATGQPTIPGVAQDTETGHTPSLAGHYSVGSGNGTWLNGTDLLATGATKENDYMWLTLRLFFIACFIVGLIVLTWGSYTIHRKCFDDRPQRKYQKALLL